MPEELEQLLTRELNLEAAQNVLQIRGLLDLADLAKLPVRCDNCVENAHYCHYCVETLQGGPFELCLSSSTDCRPIAHATSRHMCTFMVASMVRGAVDAENMQLS